MIRFDFDGRVYLVTGGGSGIGAAVARRLTEASASVATFDQRSIGGSGAPRRLDLVVDVSDSEAVGSGVRTILERFGRIDGLVQCAGITRDRVHWKLSDDDWDTVLAINLGGAFRVMRAVVPALRESAGAVVNVSSINGLRGKFGQANYAASKAGLIALTKTAARELGSFGIRVNAVAPGLVRTPMTASMTEDQINRSLGESALGRISEPDDIAQAILFLLSDAARQITGQTLSVDAGQHM